MSDALRIVREALESVFEGQTDYTKVAAAVRLLPSLESQVRAEERAACLEEIAESRAAANEAITRKLCTPKQAPEGAAMSWLVTDHAITRYIERVRPRISRDLAREDLEAAASTAHYVGPRTDGAERWRGPRPRRLRFIVEPGSPPKLITVLAGCEAARRDRRPRR